MGEYLDYGNQQCSISGLSTPTPKESAYQQSLDKTIQEDEELNPSQHGWKKTLGVWVLLLRLSCWHHNLPQLQSANAGKAATCQSDILT